MIPYDDLVAALTNWRARQGLPVSIMAGGANAGSGPVAGPPPASGPMRAAPPQAPGKKRAESDVSDLDVDSSALLEEHDDDEVYTAESTAIGGAPERPTNPTDMRRRRGNSNDW